MAKVSPIPDFDEFMRAHGELARVVPGRPPTELQSEYSA
jgi:hypothetical protein